MLQVLTGQDEGQDRDGSDHNVESPDILAEGFARRLEIGRHRKLVQPNFTRSYKANRNRRKIKPPFVNVKQSENTTVHTTAV